MCAATSLFSLLFLCVSWSAGQVTDFADQQGRSLIITDADDKYSFFVDCDSDVQCLQKCPTCLENHFCATECFSGRCPPKGKRNLPGTCQPCSDCTDKVMSYNEDDDKKSCYARCGDLYPDLVGAPIIIILLFSSLLLCSCVGNVTYRARKLKAAGINLKTTLRASMSTAAMDNQIRKSRNSTGPGGRASNRGSWRASLRGASLRQSRAMARNSKVSPSQSVPKPKAKMLVCGYKLSKVCGVDTPLDQILKFIDVITLDSATCLKENGTFLATVIPVPPEFTDQFGINASVVNNGLEQIKTTLEGATKCCNKCGFTLFLFPILYVLDVLFCRFPSNLFVIPPILDAVGQEIDKLNAQWGKDKVPIACFCLPIDDRVDKVRSANTCMVICVGAREDIEGVWDSMDKQSGGDETWERTD